MKGRLEAAVVGLCRPAAMKPFDIIEFLSSPVLLCVLCLTASVVSSPISVRLGEHIVEAKIAEPFSSLR